MNRRGFLKAIFAGAAAIAVPVSAINLVAPKLFRLRGDGLHDDTAALQALIDGKPVIAPNGTEIRREGNVIYIPAGTYHLGPSTRLSVFGA